MLSMAASSAGRSPVLPNTSPAAKTAGPAPPVADASARPAAAEPDGTIIERSRTDSDQFAAIFDRHASEIYRYAARRLGAQAASDVLSDVFLVAFRNRLRYRPERA